ncbi:MAG: amidohydrolase [Bacteroidales bacterium]|nr:amidohydrolase [Bacteroidales bacterium]
MAIYTNIHTHIFNLKCVPDRFYGFPAAKLLSKRAVSWGLATVLKWIVPFSQKDRLDRYAKILLVGSKKNQYLVFMDLKNSYHMRMRFVVLSLDMDMMEAGKPENNYETQLTHLFEVKKKHLNNLLPFLSIDPRKQYPKPLYDYIREKFDKYGFVGLKIYPALGYFPFDPKLEDLYKFAVDNNIPVMTHCTKGGVYFQGKIRQEHLKPANLNPNPVYDHDYTKDAKKRIKHFKNHFTHPRNFEEVLAVYPQLKICFGHFGGSSQVIKSLGSQDNTPVTNFFLKDKEMVANKKYPNVFADVSYTLSEIKKIRKYLVDDVIQDPTFRNRVMFGTDYFLTIMEKKEKRLVDEFLDQIPPYDFQKIAVENCNEYLTSTYYQP